MSHNEKFIGRMGGEGGCRTGLYGTSLACASSILSRGANGPTACGGLVEMGWKSLLCEDSSEITLVIQNPPNMCLIRIKM